MDIGNLQNSSAGQAKAQVVTLKPTDNQLPQAANVEASAASSAKTEKASEASREQVEKAVESISDFVQSVRRNINFSVEATSGRFLVMLIDSESGDLVRQIPSEEALALAENLNSAGSVLFEAKA